jgi:hypothetical protein
VRRKARRREFTRYSSCGHFSVTKYGLNYVTEQERPKVSVERSAFRVARNQFIERVAAELRCVLATFIAAAYRGSSLRIFRKTCPHNRAPGGLVGMGS